jgi:peptidoglycan/LPS O-acetylase OafA/YrhL
MIGYIRLILALMVLLSHAGVKVYNLNPGVIAVVIFYMLAGGVVSHLWHDVIEEGEGKLYRFYKDRFLRIFPHYLYTLTLTLLFLLITDYGKPEYNLLAIINNLLIIPLNFFMMLDSTVMTSPDWNLIPPAWSLGTELQAYLLLPLAFMYKRFAIALFMISISIQMLANFNVIHTDYFGYRLLPGVLFIFLLGSQLKNKLSKGTVLAYTLIIVATSVMYSYFDAREITQVYTREVLLGIIIGIPLLSVANAVSFKLKFNKLTGALSYGVFLNHFLVIWILDFMGYKPTDSGYLLI